MITISRKLKKDHSDTSKGVSSECCKRISVRDKLLVKEVQEMNENLPNTCSLNFPDPNLLHQFTLTVAPDEGYWQGGKFTFNVLVPEEYNMEPPSVVCDTPVWHPNISLEGAVCLSLLRPGALGPAGWAPTRRLTHVLWGLNSLFTDLLNFEDPLNLEAAEMYKDNKVLFQKTIQEYINESNHKR